jgi:hypothetical protein
MPFSKGALHSFGFVRIAVSTPEPMQDVFSDEPWEDGTVSAKKAGIAKAANKTETKFGACGRRSHQ